jgi:hypothetical protein
MPSDSTIVLATLKRNGPVLDLVIKPAEGGESHDRRYRSAAPATCSDQKK